MRLLLSSALLGLAWFAAVNILLSIFTWGTTVVMAGRRSSGSARVFLAMRLLPAAASILFALAVFLPAHWRFEPAESDESFGIALSMLAALGLVLLGRTAIRLITVVMQDRRLSALMREGASRLHGDAFEIAGHSGVSLAGILRPRIVVGSEARAALTAEELDVAISHEVAHRRSGDNLKRVLMFCAPDVLGWFGAARWLEDRWQAEIECEADAYAVRGDESRAVVLASALLKVAQLAGRSRMTPSIAWSAFHVPTLLEIRIRRLVGGRSSVPAAHKQLWLAALGMACVLPGCAWLLGLSQALHQVTEVMVMRLP